MKALDTLARGIERAMMVFAALGLLAIMLIVVVDVVLRYVFAAPLSWSHDVIGMYLVALVFFAALADTFRRGGHIRIDLFESLRRSRAYALGEIVGLCLAILFFVLIARLMVGAGWEGFLASEVMDGAIPWPTWPPQFIGAAGVGMLILRLGLAVAGRIAALAAGHAYEPEDAHRLHGESVE